MFALHRTRGVAKAMQSRLPACSASPPVHIDNSVVADQVAVSRTNGVAGFGCGWHHADFDDFELLPLSDKSVQFQDSSFLLDIVPGTKMRNDTTGTVGAVIELA